MKVLSSTELKLSTIYLASTQGFCAGVASAIEVVERALLKYGTPLYVRHHIVHNTRVIKEFEMQGVVFIEELSDVPENQTVIFSAHGTSPCEYVKARNRGLTIIDATCPLVSKIHRQAVRFSERGVQTILIGHRGHQELVGTSGYVNQNLLHIVEDLKDIEKLDLDQNKPIGYLTQTTLSVDDTSILIQELRSKFPDVIGPPKADICYATSNRQNSVKEMAVQCDVIVVCGSPHSSNSNRLRETAAQFCEDSYIIDEAVDFKFEWLDKKTTLGITSGASVPDSIVNELVELIQSHIPSVEVFQEASIEDGIKFPIPQI